MKVALVYDRVNKWGGAERVLLALHEIFPAAPLFTSVYNPMTAPWAKIFPEVVLSFLQKIPFAKNHHDMFAPLMPLVFETFNFDDYDVVISVTSEAAKGIITKPSTKHICICLTPTRYLWSGYSDYFRNSVAKTLSKPWVNYLRKWDRVAAKRPDIMVAISSEVKKRIKKYYGRESELIFPPVDVEKFEIINSKYETNSKSKYLSLKKLQGRNTKESNNYLIVSRLVPYKKVDLAIQVFNELKWPLVVVGKGSEEKKLKSIAGPTIKFLRNLSDNDLFQYYKNAKALIFPQNEDFGLVAVEAQSFGIPVIAYKSGGALDIVKEGLNGIFFNKQNIKSLKNALIRFEKQKFDRTAIMKSTQRFRFEIFKINILKLVNNEK